ncbi:MAG: sel1 repeat family protein [Bdellovibrio sp.]|nr:sel1 repeat family protein [Bdellovibrio sp.]
MHGFKAPLVLSLFILILASVIAFNGDFIRDWWHERSARLNKENALSYASDICQFKNAANTSMFFFEKCNVLIRNAKETNDEKEILRVLEIMCAADNALACYDFGMKLRDTQADRAIQLFKKACRDGMGGNMQACGMYSRWLKTTDKTKALELAGYACKSGHVEFCNDQIIGK